MDLSFPNLGIEIEKLVSSLDVFGFKIMFYGLIIGLGMVLGVSVALRLAKKEGLDPDIFVDLALVVIPLGIVGARLYYVLFMWDYYGSHPAEILNIRGGGLAIYGGIIVGALTVIVFCIITKRSFWHIADITIIVVIIGQIMGRWGNFFNCEAFGGFSDNIFAMRINRELVNPSMISEALNADMQKYFPEIADQYIQVHPTFLYESGCNLIILLFMLWFRPRRKFTGAILSIYMMGYGMVRFFVEGLRTDQLLLWNTKLAVSQLLSVFVILGGISIWIIRTLNIKKHPEQAFTCK